MGKWDKEDMSIALRPHHGMCLQFFEGKGYDPEFTDCLSRLIRELSADPGQKIRLTASADDVCRHCPNNEAGTCVTAEKVMKYDRKVLQICGLREETELPYEEFVKLVKGRILDTGKRSGICGDCVWDGICRRHDGTLTQADGTLFKETGAGKTV